MQFVREAAGDLFLALEHLQLDRAQVPRLLLQPAKHLRRCAYRDRKRTTATAARKCEQLHRKAEQPVAFFQNVFARLARLERGRFQRALHLRRAIQPVG